MMRIGLLSDTHHHLDEAVFGHFESCDEVWHAGDFGTIGIANQLMAFRPLKGVYGNIDGADIRTVFPERLRWKCEGVDVLIQHIGGYPGRYSPDIKEIMRSNSPDLFISGHSHILKVVYDPEYECLHINPGAAGRQGWHVMRTLVRFTIEKDSIRDCEVIDLGRR